ncbi:MAG: FAD-dependent oxidoreductase [Spirochaetes bacterium]|nr:FAD-dependent oxidoreductase [Spirochaetota bacterium]
MGQLNLPFHPPADILICGSSLGACELAVQMAERGRRTVLAMERVNPFYEGVAALRSWVEEGAGKAFPSLLGPVLARPEFCESMGGRLYFNPAAAVMAIEDALCDAGVSFFYNTAPSLALARGRSLAGVVFGGKTGLFAIPAEVVVDATPSATVAQAAGVAFDPPGSPRILHYTVELSHPVPSCSGKYRSGDLAVDFEIHHRYASFAVALSPESDGPLGEIEDFRRAAAAVLAFEYREGETRFRAADGYLIEGDGGATTLHGCGQVREYPNLFIFGPRGTPGASGRNSLLGHPHDAWAPFVAGSRAIDELLARGPKEKGSEPLRAMNAAVDGRCAGLLHPEGEVGATDPGFDEPGLDGREVEFSPPALSRTAPLLIAGAGTSGIAAAWRAGKKGMQAVCLDRGLEPGGTNTLGGVTKLWYGNETPAFKAFYEEVGATHGGLNAVPFSRALGRLGVPLYPNLSLTGVTKAGERLTSVLAATPHGLMAFGADLFIDATGDGALAAWAGAPYRFGGEQDDTTLWGSFAYFEAGRPEARRPFLSPCDERSARDATRFILAMRRNSPVRFDVAHTPVPFYLAPRESRHIEGRGAVGYLDVLAGRRFKRGILRARGNLDNKGIATSDAAKAGFIPEHWLEVFEATIPYDAFLSPALSNGFIAGKAYAITHDALAMARMQRDLYVLGMAAVEAASLAMGRGKRFDAVPIDELQSALFDLGALSPGDIAEDDLGFGATAEALARSVAQAESLDEALVASARLAILGKPTALSALSPWASIHSPALSRLRCFLGDERGAEMLAAQWRVDLGDAGLPQELYHGKQATPHFMPDQGYAPLPALSLGNLAVSRAAEIKGLLLSLASRLEPESLAFNARWGYLFIFANACEANPDPVFAPILGRLRSSAPLSVPVVSRGGDLRGAVDPHAERHGYLRLALSRAMARCGSPDGALALIGFLDEARLPWARSARSVLREISGIDAGFDAKGWTRWLENRRENLPCVPDSRRFG